MTLCCGVRHVCKKAEVCMLLQAVQLDDCHLELAGSNMLADKQEFITFALAKLGHGSQTEAKAARGSSLAFKRLIIKVRRPLCVEAPHSAKAKLDTYPNMTWLLVSRMTLTTWCPRIASHPYQHLP